MSLPTNYVKRAEVTMRNLDDLLDEAKTGTLTEEELSYIAGKIKKHNPDCDDDDDLYTLIYALGIADCIDTPDNIYAQPRGTKYRKLVEDFLYYPNDPSIASIALKTLCDYWGYTKDYLNEIKKFIKGVDWDKDGDVTLTAISIAGEYLRTAEKKDKELFQLLINIWEKYSKKDMADVMAESAYEALARAAGQEWNVLFKSKKPDSNLLATVYKMCK